LENNATIDVIAKALGIWERHIEIYANKVDVENEARLIQEEYDEKKREVDRLDEVHQNMMNLRSRLYDEKGLRQYVNKGCNFKSKEDCLSFGDCLRCGFNRDCFYHSGQYQSVDIEGSYDDCGYPYPRSRTFWSCCGTEGKGCCKKQHEYKEKYNFDHRRNIEECKTCGTQQLSEVSCMYGDQNRKHWHKHLFVENYIGRIDDL